MRYWIPTIILMQILLSNGCSSIKTTAYDRLEDDTLIANPDEHLKGIPVSLKVPTHLELTVEEKTFWRAEGTELIPVTSCRCTRTVSHKVQYTEKIFLVDPMRPGAGPRGDVASNSYGFSFKNDDITDEDIKKNIRERDYQYSGKGQLSGIHYHIQDETIIRSAELLNASLQFIKKLPSPKGSLSSFGEGNQDVKGLNLIQTTRVIAWSRFDLNSEHFEGDVWGFLETYVNQKPGDAVSPDDEG